jgi:HTH-type transcriptional repressor of NAD biosynthesis genes
MKRGLVIGKFMPLHKGHIALIDFAASHSDEVIVSMSYTDNDRINPWLRLNWIKEQFSNNPRVKVHTIKDDFDNELLPLPERTAIWAKKMKEVYPPINILISSERYGEHFAKNLDALHLLFDMARTAVPVSATAIRNNPFTNWKFIPDNIRPYFVKKICFYGPESTGKSTMTTKMSAYYKTGYVPEAARDILQSNDFSEKEITAIAQLQHQYIQEKLKTANKLLFCDTDAITTAIYSQHYLGEIPALVTDLEKQTVYDHYFLMDVDTPWIADALRDQGHRRQDMMKIFEQELIKRNIAYTIIQGNYTEREEKVITYIDQMIAEL